MGKSYIENTKNLGGSYDTTRFGQHWSFKNGYCVSVQWGQGQYCDAPTLAEDSHKWESAEIAIFDPKGEFVPLANHDQVWGYVDPEQLLAILGMVASGNVEMLRHSTD